jgi:hypothetical protein
LRYPAAGETSGIAMRFMGIGKPVILSDGLEVSRIPDAACVRVDTGPTEEPMLAAAMQWLATSTSDAREIGARASRHIAEQHAIDAVAAAYWRVLTSCYDGSH